MTIDFQRGGFLILDKPLGISSAKAVSEVKRIFKCKKIGHGGTLDPLASGILPLAIGEATKAFDYVASSTKQYRFTVTFGEERSTDDAEGQVTAETSVLPTREQIEAVLPQFTGAIQQIPPAFSALKINGERAYKLARAGEMPVMAARTVEVFSLLLLPSQGGGREGGANGRGHSQLQPPPQPSPCGGGSSSARDYPIPYILQNAQDLRKNLTDAEQKLWQSLRSEQLGIKFRKQHPIGHYIADFACLNPKLIVEVDGGQHGESEAIAKDEARTAFLLAQGFRVLRFWNNEVLQNCDGVLQVIVSAIGETGERSSPHPNRSPLAAEGIKQATFEVTCGKGTYVRSLARDIARKVNSLGYVSMLRRISVGKFHEHQAISLENCEELVHSGALFKAWVTLELALDDIPAIEVDTQQARKVRQGQPIAVQAKDGRYLALHHSKALALSRVENGELRPVRVFNLSDGET